MQVSENPDDSLQEPFKESNPFWKLQTGGPLYLSAVEELRGKTPFYLRTVVQHEPDRDLAALVLLQKLAQAREKGQPIQDEGLYLRTIIKHNIPLAEGMIKCLFPDICF